MSTLMFAQPDPPPAPGLNERRMALVKEVWHRMFSLSFNPESEVLGMSVRSVEAVKLASDMDAERAAYGLSNGVELSWSVPERATISLIQDQVDRKVELTAAYDARMTRRVCDWLRRSVWLRAVSAGC